MKFVVVREFTRSGKIFVVYEECVCMCMCVDKILSRIVEFVE